jgi:hypothetical protein
VAATKTRTFLALDPREKHREPELGRGIGRICRVVRPFGSQCVGSMCT